LERQPNRDINDAYQIARNRD